MVLDWTTIIVTLISSAIGAGAITSLVTLKEKKREKQLENKEKEEEIESKNSDRWEKLADQLSDQIESLNERIDKKDARITELEDTNAELRHRLDEANTAAVKAALLRCNRLSCERRSPPLGYAELTPEEMLIESKKLAVEHKEIE